MKVIYVDQRDHSVTVIEATEKGIEVGYSFNGSGTTERSSSEELIIPWPEWPGSDRFSLEEWAVKVFGEFSKNYARLYLPYPSKWWGIVEKAWDARPR